MISKKKTVVIPKSFAVACEAAMRNPLRANRLPRRSLVATLSSG